MSTPPGVLTYALLQGSLMELFANNTAMGVQIKNAIRLRNLGQLNAAKEVEEQLVAHIAKDKQLMTKVKKALRAHYLQLRTLLIPTAGNGNGTRPAPQKDDPMLQLAQLTIALARGPPTKSRGRRRPSSTTSGSETTQD